MDGSRPATSTIYATPDADPGHLAAADGLVQLSCEELSDCYMEALEARNWTLVSALDAELNQRIALGLFLPEPD